MGTLSGGNEDDEGGASIRRRTQSGRVQRSCSRRCPDYEAAVSLVRRRGLLMESACPPGKGGMAAIIGLELDTVESCCADVDGVVRPKYKCTRSNRHLWRSIGCRRAIALVKELGRRELYH